MSLVSMPLYSTDAEQDVVHISPLNINVKRGQMSAIVRDISRNCSMFYFG